MISSIEELRSLLEAQDESSKLRVRNEAIEPSVQVIAASEHPDLHDGLLLNKSLSDAALQGIASSSHSTRIRRLLASRSRLPDEALATLARDDDPSVRAAVARHDSLPRELRERLMRDPSLRVQSAAVVERNPGTDTAQTLSPASLLNESVPASIGIGNRQYRRRWIIELAAPVEHAAADLARRLTGEVQAHLRTSLHLVDEQLPGIVALEDGTNIVVLEIELMADALELASAIDREVFLALARFSSVKRLQGWPFDRWASYWDISRT